MSTSILRDQSKAIDKTIRTLKEQILTLEEEQKRLLETCTHRYDDGTSAVIDLWLTVGCSICGDVEPYGL